MRNISNCKVSKILQIEAQSPGILAFLKFDDGENNAF